MGKFLRLSLAFGTVVGVLIGIGYSRPSWAASYGVDWWTLPELEKNLQLVLQEQEQLDRQTTRIRDRLAGRQRVVDDLVAGRMSLLEAAAQFRSLSVRFAGRGPSYKEYHRGNSEGERLCRHVIGWTEATLSERTPILAKMTVRDLETELARLLQDDGTVHLPAE